MIRYKHESLLHHQSKSCQGAIVYMRWCHLSLYIGREKSVFDFLFLAWSSTTTDTRRVSCGVRVFSAYNEIECVC